MNADPNDTRATTPGDREIVLSRLLDAPRAAVWRAWTEPDRIVRWWGPNGFTTTNHEMDVRPGGVWRYTMHGPDGTDYPNRVRYTEIVAPERLVYEHGDDGPPEEWNPFHVTVSLAEQAGGTEVTMRLLVESAAVRQGYVDFGAVTGGQQTLARLADFLTDPSTEL